MEAAQTQNAKTAQKYSTVADISSYSKSYQSRYVPNAMKNNVKTRAPLGLKIEPTTSLDYDLDELSEHLSFSKDESMSVSALTNSVTPRGGLNITNPVPYSSGIQSNPFSRHRGSFDLTITTKTVRDTKDRQSYSPGLLKLALTNSNNKSATIANASNRLSISTPLLHVIKPNLMDCLARETVLENLFAFVSSSDILHICRISAEVKSNKSIQITAKKILKGRITKGLKSGDQMDFWRFYVPFGCVKEMNPCVFINMALRESKFHRDISKDVDRTLRETPFFAQEKGRLTLYRVLIAISNTETEVGYIQGMNSVIGTLLLHLKEEDAYWMALYMLRKRKLCKVFTPPFLKTDIWNYQLEILMQNYLPDIFDHLTYKGLSIGYFSTSWFLTLYSHFLRTSLVMKIWNLYFLLGERIFIQVALAIFIYYKDMLLRKDVDDLGAFFSKNLRKLTAEEELIKLALDFKVTKRLLRQIEGYYHREIRSSRLVLQCDHEDPLKMSFYAPNCNTSFSEIQSDSFIKSSPDSKQVDSPILQINEKPISEIPLQTTKKKESKSRRSLLELLSKDPLSSPQKAPLSLFSKKNSQISFQFNSVNIDKNTRINDSQNLELEELQNISQSTETQTNIQSNVGNSHSLNLNSPQTLLWQKLDDLNTPEIKKQPVLGEETNYPMDKADSPTQNLAIEDNETPAVKIPHFMKLKQVLGQKNLDSRIRSYSLNKPSMQNKSTKANNLTNPNPLTIENNRSLSFLTDKPDEIDNGYFDDQIKEELQRETTVFTPKFEGRRSNSQSIVASAFEKNATEFEKLSFSQY